MGKNKPHKKTIGKRRKLEKVCASKTSLTETATNRPRNVELTAMKKNPTHGWQPGHTGQIHKKRGHDQRHGGVEQAENNRPGRLGQHEQSQGNGGQQKTFKGPAFSFKGHGDGQHGCGAEKHGQTHHPGQDIRDVENGRRRI